MRNSKRQPNEENWKLEIGPILKVWNNSGQIQPPASRAMESLLRELADAYPFSVSRRQLAVRLFPDSAASASTNALRQSIFRLRNLLGSEMLRISAREVGLAPGRWEIVRTSNPPVGDLSELKSTQPAYLANIIQETAERDPDVARNLLHGGIRILEYLPLLQLLQLLQKVKPKSNTDDGVLEYLLVSSTLCHYVGDFRRSLIDGQRAFRLANRLRLAAQRSQAASIALFTYTESGDMVAAENWMSTVLEHDKRVVSRLSVANARACFAWNNGNIPEALSQMDVASKLVHVSSLRTQTHYWSNYAILAIEAGQNQLANDCFAEARRATRPGFDLICESNLCFAEALQARSNGDVRNAIEMLRENLDIYRGLDRVIVALYFEEALAETYAMVGQRHLAHATWNSIEKTRLSLGAKLTPRLLMQKARIETLTF